MFTGIITHMGKIARLATNGDWELLITAPHFATGMVPGASVACNGVCLTATRIEKDGFYVQVSHETLDKTTLKGWKEGMMINLERALKAGDELGGHFVSGHVDGVATLEKIDPVADSWRLTFGMPPALARFIAPKGSITLNGISLTVNEATKHHFTVNIIPHTWQNTTLHSIQAGGEVNLEIDVIARYLDRIQSISSL